MLKINRTVFLDRDGTINKDDNGYLFETNKLEFLPGVLEGMRRLQKQFLLIIVTNQSGIGRKKYTIKEYKNFRDFMHKKLKESGISITEEYFCPHHPKAENIAYKKTCNCRKPATGMLEKAKVEHNIDPTQSWMVGDKPTDIKAGLTIGSRAIGILSKESTIKEFKKIGAEYICNNLGEATNYILQDESQN